MVASQGCSATGLCPHDEVVHKAQAGPNVRNVREIQHDDGIDEGPTKASAGEGLLSSQRLRAVVERGNKVAEEGAPFVSRLEASEFFVAFDPTRGIQVHMRTGPTTWMAAVFAALLVLLQSRKCPLP